jgi:signal peptidase I
MTEVLPDRDNRPRRPIVAALLSLALPGLGQLYNGEVNKGLWLFLAYVVIGVPGVAVATLYAPTFLMLPLLCLSVVLTLGLWIGGAADAGRRAARLRTFVRRDWQVSGFYALALLAGQVFFFALLAGPMRQHMVQPFSIPSSSMEPGVLRGDSIFADKRYNCPECKTSVARGDIGIFVYPDNRTQYYIKRVIGLPGDRISINGRDVAVNGKSLSRGETSVGDKIVSTEKFGAKKWRAQWRSGSAAAAFEATVPPGHVFMLGDNRDLTTDSRNFGAVPLSDLVGKARQVWMSLDNGRVRWERLGMVLK